MKTLKYIVLLLGTAAFAQKNTCQHLKHSHVEYAALDIDDIGNNTRSDTFDILNYTINLDLTNGAAEQIAAACEVKFKPLMTGQNSIRLDLFGLTVDSVKFQGQTTTYAYVDQSLTIDFGTTLGLTDTSTVDVFYHGTPLVDGSTFGGFDFNGNYWYNLGVAFQYEPHNFGRGWFPCFDNFVERSTYRFEVTTPSNYISYANGNLLLSTQPTPTTLLRVWETETDFPTYLASVAAAPYIEINKTFTSITGEQIPVVLACLPSDSLELEQSFVNLQASFDAYEAMLGPYRWEKVGYAVTPVGAMEHPGNIAYPSNLVNGNLSGETIMAHELAHHWFGNLITCNDAKEMWINEGWAEYLSIYFLEAVYGEERYLEEVRNNHLNMLNSAHIADNGYQILAEMPLNITYGRHTYNKGADVIHTLRSYMGDPEFFTTIKDLLDTYAFADITSEQFRDYLINNGFPDAEHFFNDWIFQKGWSQFDINAYSVTQNATDYTLNIEFVQNLREATNYYTNVPVTIAFYDANMNEVEEEVLLSGNYTSHTFTVPFEPTMVSINGDDRISLAAYHEKVWVKDVSNTWYTDVDIRINSTSITDSALVHLQQNYVGSSGTYNDAQYIMSPDRYWNIKSHDLSNLTADFEFRYNGNTDFLKDFELMQNISSTSYSEERMVLMYREHGGMAWQPYPNQELIAGSNVYNKTGRIKANNIQVGDYAFAISKWPIGVTEADKESDWEIFPNPANQNIFLEGVEGVESASICDSLGRCILKISGAELKSPIDISGLSEGSYIFAIHKPFGDRESKIFVVKK